MEEQSITKARGREIPRFVDRRNLAQQIQRAFREMKLPARNRLSDPIDSGLEPDVGRLHAAGDRLDTPSQKFLLGKAVKRVGGLIMITHRLWLCEVTVVSRGILTKS